MGQPASLAKHGGSRGRPHCRRINRRCWKWQIPGLPGGDYPHGNPSLRWLATGILIGDSGLGLKKPPMTVRGKKPGQKYPP